MFDGLPLKVAALSDRAAMGKALALLGQSRIASNLNQLAHAANIGALIMTEDEEAGLKAALQHVSEIRALLLKATGLRTES